MESQKKESLTSSSGTCSDQQLLPTSERRSRHLPHMHLLPPPRLDPELPPLHPSAFLTDFTDYMKKLKLTPRPTIIFSPVPSSHRAPPPPVDLSSARFETRRAPPPPPDLSSVLKRLKRCGLQPYGYKLRVARNKKV